MSKHSGALGKNAPKKPRHRVARDLHLAHGLDLDFLDEDDSDLEGFQKMSHRDRRSEACDDDAESTMPFIDMMPEETHHEEASPLDFG